MVDSETTEDQEGGGGGGQALQLVQLPPNALLTCSECGDSYHS